jgi:hypothetical protein
MSNINEKLRSLTKEQAKELCASLNSAMAAPKPKKAKASKAKTKKNGNTVK